MCQFAASLFQEQTQKSDATTTDQKSSDSKERIRSDAAKSDVTEQTCHSGKPLLLPILRALQLVIVCQELLHLHHYYPPASYKENPYMKHYVTSVVQRSAQVC